MRAKQHSYSNTPQRAGVLTQTKKILVTVPREYAGHTQRRRRNLRLGPGPCKPQLGFSFSAGTLHDTNGLLTD